MADRVPAFTLAQQGLHTNAAIHWNLLTSPLVEEAVRRSEGILAADGPLVVATGKHTGRSAKDKFIVKDAETEDTVWWGKTNVPMDPAFFNALKEDFLAEVAKRDTLFVADLFGGSQPEHRVRVRVVNEYAWHNLFIRTLLVRPKEEELAGFVPEYTIIDLPNFRADPERHGCRSETVVAVNFSEKLILIGGTAYAGEMKKSVFGILNYLLPAKGVMPMHCSANIGANGDTAIFFGLSGTGKTTLSADASRTLIGDDEHGWSDTAVFNFEGGCYAKMIRLSAENSRGSYPIDFIPNASAENMGPVPKNIIMLTADAYGVLPPIAKLTPDQAMYHFLSGYTARVAGTEIGVTEPEATFSTCFGAPFMPRHPSVYGNLLKERIAKGSVTCWLVNTGWTGGKATMPGVNRMPIKATRALLNAALDGSLNTAEFRKDPNFGFDVPVSVPGVDSKLLDPRKAWEDADHYDQTARTLVQQFIDNFAQFEDHVDEGVRQAAPKAA